MKSSTKLTVQQFELKEFKQKATEENKSSNMFDTSVLTIQQSLSQSIPNIKQPGSFLQQSTSINNLPVERQKKIQNIDDTQTECKVSHVLNKSNESTQPTDVHIKQLIKYSNNGTLEKYMQLTQQPHKLTAKEQQLIKKFETKFIGILSNKSNEEKCTTILELQKYTCKHQIQQLLSKNNIQPSFHITIVGEDCNLLSAKIKFLSNLSIPKGKNQNKDHINLMLNQLADTHDVSSVYSYQDVNIISLINNDNDIKRINEYMRLISKAIDGKSISSNEVAFIQGFALNYPPLRTDQFSFWSDDPKIDNLKENYNYILNLQKKVCSHLVKKQLNVDIGITQWTGNFNKLIDKMGALKTLIKTPMIFKDSDLIGKKMQEFAKYNDECCIITLYKHITECSR